MNFLKNRTSLILAAALLLAVAVASVLAFKLADKPSAAAFAGTTYEVFDDRGQTFVRAGTAQGLSVGASLPVLDKKRERLGEGVVMEIWDGLARLRLDPAVDASDARFAAAPTDAAPSGSAAPSEAASAPSESANAGGAANPSGLRGRASIIGVGPLKRVVVYNNSSTGWTGCELRLPNNRRYMLQSLPAGTSEGIMVAKFAQDGVPRDVELTSVAVHCEQGTARFSM